MRETTTESDELHQFLASNLALDNNNDIVDEEEEDNMSINLLKFWKDNQKKISNFALLAQFIFSIPAISIANEGNFSKACWTIIDRWTHLDPETVVLRVCTAI